MSRTIQMKTIITAFLEHRHYLSLRFLLSVKEEATVRADERDIAALVDSRVTEMEITENFAHPRIFSAGTPLRFPTDSYALLNGEEQGIKLVNTYDLQLSVADLIKTTFLVFLSLPVHLVIKGRWLRQNWVVNDRDLDCRQLRKDAWRKVFPNNTK
jgi:hypothetical protein